MSSQKKFLWLLLILVVILGVFFFRNKQAGFVDDVGVVTKNDNKVYRDDSFDFVFQYPKYLTVEVTRPENTGALKRYRIYDNTYIAPSGTTGRAVRSQLREVTIDAYPNTGEDWDGVVGLVTRENGQMKVYEKNFIVHEAMTMVGPVTSVVRRLDGVILFGTAVDDHKETLLNIMNSATSTVSSR
jgi:hypothetical protein